MPSYPDTARTVDDVVALLHRDATSSDEPVGADQPRFTGLDHGLQCAAGLLRERPDDLELQVAGLIHDLGHRLTPGEPDLHGVVGGAWVRDLLGDRVSALVELHVDAKRYLVATEPGYRGLLSAGSAETLVVQGEALSPDEAAAFEVERHSADAILLRRADEAAKVPGAVVPGLDAWLPVLAAVAASVRGPRGSPAAA